MTPARRGKSDGVFVDGDPVGCECKPACEFPCWQRIGLTDQPCCRGCAPLPSDEAPCTLTAAIADPPYIGQSKKHYEDHPDYAGEVDHAQLLERLSVYDAWALCLHSPSLHLCLDHCRKAGYDLMAGDIRVMSWVKPFAAFKKNVRVAYAWEPVIVKVADRLDNATPTRDFVAEPITMKRGLAGAKPERWCFWLFEVMGLRPQDVVVDLFPGTGGVYEAWRKWSARPTDEPGQQEAMAV